MTAFLERAGVERGEELQLVGLRRGTGRENHLVRVRSVAIWLKLAIGRGE